nr:MAG TPA: hypothetical protein [Caudoviricetes sp.]
MKNDAPGFVVGLYHTLHCGSDGEESCMILSVPVTRQQAASGPFLCVTQLRTA